MTKREIGSVAAICGRLEQLQMTTKDKKAKELIGKAKRELLQVLSACDQ